MPTPGTRALLHLHSKVLKSPLSLASSFFSTSTPTKPSNKSQGSKRGGKKPQVPPLPQGSKRVENKKPHVPPSSSASSSHHIEAFFANYAPRFRHDPTASASHEFYRLCDEFRKDADQKFKDALVKQFNDVYGTDVDSLANWQNLCHIVRIDPIPEGLRACRKAVRYSFINLVDLVDTHKTGVKVKIFKSERALSEYTLRTRKFFPRENVHAGGMLRYLLRHIYDPCDGYARRGGHSGSKRR